MSDPRYEYLFNNSFERAQAAYDNMVPDDDDAEIYEEDEEEEAFFADGDM